MTDKAISRTRGLIFLTFAVALAAAFGLPPLFELILGDSPSDATKTTLATFTTLILGPFWAWFSPDLIKTVVGGAIKSEAENEVNEYKKQHPDADNISRQRQLEYFYTIPPANHNESSIQVGSANPAIHNRWLARTAVLKLLSCNDDLVKGVAYSSAKGTLERIHGKREIIDQGLVDILFQDIYVYLKGWLMMSITHRCPMPVGYIQQRYPSIHYPNNNAYVTAIEIIRLHKIYKPDVHKAMSEILESLGTPTFQRNVLFTEVVGTLDEYLRMLVNELEKAAV